MLFSVTQSEADFQSEVPKSQGSDTVHALEKHKSWWCVCAHANLSVLLTLSFTQREPGPLNNHQFYQCNELVHGFACSAVSHGQSILYDHL